MGHVWLVGMMGSGKSTVGLPLSTLLGLPFIDTDDVVERATGSTIGELFVEGEDKFRAAERVAMASIASGERAVVSTGGGAVLSEENRVVMTASGRVVYLRADVATIGERVTFEGDRPLLGSKEDVARILDERSEMYMSVADHVVSTIGKSPSEIVLEVAECVNT